MMAIRRDEYRKKEDTEIGGRAEGGRGRGE